MLSKDIAQSVRGNISSMVMLQQQHCINLSYKEVRFEHFRV